MNNLIILFSFNDLNIKQNILLFLLLFYIVTVMFSAILFFAGPKLLYKAKINRKKALIPFYNIFIFNKVLELPSLLIILAFLPIFNLFYFLFFVSKLNLLYNGNNKTLMGLIFLPFIYIPILTDNKYKYKNTDSSVKKNEVGQSINLLTQSDIDELNKGSVVNNNVDSIFKSDIDIIQDTDPYKAYNIKIQKIEKIDAKKLEEKESINNETIEIVDLDYMR